MTIKNSNTTRTSLQQNRIPPTKQNTPTKQNNPNTTRTSLQQKQDNPATHIAIVCGKWERYRNRLQKETHKRKRTVCSIMANLAVGKSN